VSVIDAGKQELLKQITVGKGPHGIRTSLDGMFLFVDVSTDNKVAAMDTNSMEIIKQIPTGNAPFWLAVPGNH
jgi:DNA-binding beta-propeller fold protein YncE